MRHRCDRIRDWADQFFQLTQQMRATQAILGSSAEALQDLNMTDLSGMESWSDVTRDLSSWQDELAAAARNAEAAIRANYDAALQAAQGYGQAAGAANIYAGSLQRLQALIPAVAAAQQAQNNLAAATIEFDKGMKALDGMTLSRDAYLARQGELSAAFEQAKEQVTGLAAAEETLARVTTQNSLDALTGREGALARLKQQYADAEAG
jgi:hypothetical protein